MRKNSGRDKERLEASSIDLLTYLRKDLVNLKFEDRSINIILN
jgi:hypothetical protein